MKFIKTITAILIFLFCGNAITQTVDEIVEKYTEAIGGGEKINSVKSLSYTGVISSDTVKIPISVFIKGKDKIRMVLTIMGREFIQVLNGNSGWFINPFMDSSKHTLDEEDIKDLKESLEWEGKLTMYKEKGYKAELVESDLTCCYKIFLRAGNSETLYYYIDKSTFLLNKEIKVTNTNDGNITEETTPLVYKEFGGILFAIESDKLIFDGKKIRDSSRLKILELNINQDIEDILFN